MLGELEVRPRWQLGCPVPHDMTTPVSVRVHGEGAYFYLEKKSKVCDETSRSGGLVGGALNIKQCECPCEQNAPSHWADVAQVRPEQSSRRNPRPPCEDGFERAAGFRERDRRECASVGNIRNAFAGAAWQGGEDEVTAKNRPSESPTLQFAVKHLNNPGKMRSTVLWR